MKTLIFTILLFIASNLTYSQNRIFITNNKDLVDNNLFGTYKIDGYYFYIVQSHENLFEIRFEMNWYDWNLGKSIILDSCIGHVNFYKGKLLLEWIPCNNANSYQDIQIVPYEKLDFNFIKEDNVVYIKFIGAPPIPKVD